MSHTKLLSCGTLVLIHGWTKGVYHDLFDKGMKPLKCMELGLSGYSLQVKCLDHLFSSLA